jgi:diguanylate cyclase (GGDEF)-like protein/PAS domain S-box-containing protein
MNSSVVIESHSEQHTLNRRLAGFESAFNAAPIGLCVLDLDFRYVTVNERFACMYGLREGDLIGRTVTEALPGPAPQILAHLQASLQADAIVEREIVFQNPRIDRDAGFPGEVIYLRTAQPIRNAAGEVFGFSVALLDITERKQLDAALKDSEDDLCYSIALSPHVPWMADQTGELTFMSPRWHVLTGKQPEKVLLKDWALVLHPDDRDTTAEIWSHSVQSGDPYDAEYRIRSADGLWRWVRARAYPRRDSSGEIIRWYGTVEEIHDRKITAMKLEEATEELARRADQDHLTGLANRRQFDEVLGRYIERSRRTKLPLALVLLDIDHFKRYNDIAGHLAGDECLKAVAQAISGVIRRPFDLAARFGGEEFTILLPDTAPAGAMEIACRAVEAVRKLSFDHLDIRLQQISISAGVAIHNKGHLSMREDCAIALIQAADAALYEAKAAGRNRVVGPRLQTLPIPPSHHLLLASVL